jgi:2-dehydro-3-deoxygalactonokinase
MSVSRSSGPFIAAEWGSAAVHARLIDPDGAILATASETVRLADLSREDCLARLHAWRALWPHGQGPILLAGMIGSAMGLIDVPQRPCPADTGAVLGAAHRLEIEGLAVVIMPGLTCRTPHGDHDVARGEEVAALGLIARHGKGSCTLVSVPGMHGKWLALEHGRIARFHTAMTVELAQCLADRSILAPLLQGDRRIGPGESAAFLRGVDRALAGEGLARLLFTARTATLAGTLNTAEAGDYLWGLLIGADLRDALPEGPDPTMPFVVAGAPAVARAYSTALSHLGGSVTLADGAALAAAGFATLHRNLQLSGAM